MAGTHTISVVRRSEDVPVQVSYSGRANPEGLLRGAQTLSQAKPGSVTITAFETSDGKPITEIRIRGDRGQSTISIENYSPEAPEYT